MKSDLSYEDLYNRNINEYNFILIEKEENDNSNYYVLESIPNDKKNSGYSKHISLIEKKTLRPIKEESFDKSGKLLKTKEYSFNRIGDYDVLTNIKVINVQKDHSTVINFEDIIIDAKISNNLFQEMSLKRLPK